MGLSNILPGGDQSGGDGAAPADKSFGDSVRDYFKSRYQIAGGLASAVFDPSQTQPSVAPQAQIVSGYQPDYSQMIGVNAMPKQGGGLATILKLLA